MLLSGGKILWKVYYDTGEFQILAGEHLRQDDDLVITGTLAEAGTFGLQNLANAGFWVWVYGLMVWLPAYTLPKRPAANRPRAWHYPIALIMPIVCAIPVALIVMRLHPMSNHFPPIE